MFVAEDEILGVPVGSITASRSIGPVPEHSSTGGLVEKLLTDVGIPGIGSPPFSSLGVCKISPISSGRPRPQSP